MVFSSLQFPPSSSYSTFFFSFIHFIASYYICAKDPRFVCRSFQCFFFRWSQYRMPAFDILSNGSSYGRKWGGNFFSYYMLFIFLSLHLYNFFLNIFFLSLVYIFMLYGWWFCWWWYRKNCVVGDVCRRFWASFLCHSRQNKIFSSPSLLSASHVNLCVAMAF